MGCTNKHVGKDKHRQAGRRTQALQSHLADPKPRVCPALQRAVHNMTRLCQEDVVPPTQHKMTRLDDDVINAGMTQHF